MKKKIAILGSTGSIGKSSLDVIKNEKNFKVFLISANKNFNELKKQIIIYKPKIVIINNYEVFLKTKKKFKNKKINFFNNHNSLNNLKLKFDITISAIPGISGLAPTIILTKFSKEILLANKESIICGWNLIKNAAKKNNTKITPIDSEHYSILQIIKKYSFKEIEKIYLTASGGPFLNYKKKQLSSIKPSQANKHPKWKMGKKISIDSATMVNKVLEISEALKLFSFKLDKYEIIIHPESLVHAVIQLRNGFKVLLYHLPDMRILIADALNIKKFFFNYIKNRSELNKLKKLSFFPVDKKIFPVVDLIAKINSNNSLLIAFNALNEIFVDQFLKKNIDFNDISRYLKRVIYDRNLSRIYKNNCNSMKKIFEIDKASRQIALDFIRKNKHV